MGCVCLLACTNFAAETSLVVQPSGTSRLSRSIRVESLGEDYDALSWDLVLFKEFAENDLAFSGTVNVGGVECLYAVSMH